MTHRLAASETPLTYTDEFFAMSSDCAVHRASAHAGGLATFVFELRDGASLKVESRERPGYILYLVTQGVSQFANGCTPPLIIEKKLQLCAVENTVLISSKSSSTGILLLIPGKLMKTALSSLRKLNPAITSAVSLINLNSATSLASRLLTNCLESMANDMMKDSRRDTILRSHDLVWLLLLEAIRETTAVSETSNDPSDPWYVTSVEKNLEARLGAPIPVRDLARIIGISPRTLHHGFRKHRGCSPLKYIREQRLKQIRKELSDPDSDTTITEAAMKWGFTHLGRFSAYYMAQFGEKPSDTLHRARKQNLTGALEETPFRFHVHGSGR